MNTRKVAGQVKQQRREQPGPRNIWVTTRQSWMRRCWELVWQWSQAALESHQTSQAAIGRAIQLYTEPARSWVELRIQKACRSSCTLMWVRGHAGVWGNEEADRRANLRAYGGRVMQCVERMTPAGIRQDFPIHTKRKHLSWPRKAVKGLQISYIITDRGPTKRWLWVIGRSQEQMCECGEIQNGVHLRGCKRIGDGKGRSIEECLSDMEWCAAVVDFLT